MNSIFYIYVLLNNLGNIKIGITTNFKQRLQSLSGSNSGGNKIIDYYVSDATYLYSIEKTMHLIFKDYRISGTEWFTGVTYNEVVNKLKELFASDDYTKCNELRRKYNDSRTPFTKREDDAKNISTESENKHNE